MANEIYAVVRTDNLMGTDVNSYLDSVRFYAGSPEIEAPIENGNIVLVGDLLTGERELHKATAPAKDTPLEKLGLVATPEVLYDERQHRLDEFRNEAGDNVRIYYLHTGDEFGVTLKALSAASDPAVGNLVELQAGDTKLKVVASATSQTTTVGKIIAIEKAGMYTYYVVRVA